ncbi:MAG: phosphatidate cytidylyltransferase [Bacteroidales bacterium]
MSTIVKRTLTGIVFLTILIGSILGGPITFFILLAVLLVGLMWEFLSLPNGYKPLKWLNIAMILGVYVIVGFITMSHLSASWLYVLALLPSVLFFVELYRRHPKGTESTALSVFSWVYIGFPLILLFRLGYTLGSYEYSFILGFFILTWLYDTFAYLIGTSIGKRKLFERISPKKSWEGFIGGATVTLLCSYFVSLLFPVFSHQQWAVVSLIASIGGTLGDLTESRIKRQFEIKDTSKLLPGHGGLLDRFDSILVSVPIYFVYLHIIF